MTLRRIDNAQARLLALAVEHDFPKRTADWLNHLNNGNLTQEMQDVFEAFGYLEKRARRQSKPQVALPPEEPAPTPNEDAPVRHEEGMWAEI